jgi:1-acyl-sn-glycerol-3-phosphate acyltransferase
MTMLRSALFNLVFYAITFALTLYGIVLRLLAPRRLTDLARLWARLVLGALRVLCRIDLQVIGRERLTPDQPMLIASRHQSAFDTLVWLTLLPRCSYVLKRELLRIPVFGWLMLPAGMIAVDRSGGATAMRRLMRDGAKAAAEGQQIVIFPEGTRAHPGTLLPLHPGVAALATATRLPVVPVVTDSGLRWGRRAFRKRAGTIHIRILPPLAATSRSELMARLETVLRSEAAVENSVG